MHSPTTCDATPSSSYTIDDVPIISLNKHLIVKPKEGCGVSEAILYRSEVALRFNIVIEDGDPVDDFKFTFQYSHPTKTLSYNEHRFSNLFEIVAKQQNRHNPYACLFERAPQDLADTVQKTVLNLRIKTELSGTNGTGFLVAPGIVQTAKHNVLPEGIGASSSDLSFTVSSNNIDPNKKSRGFRTEVLGELYDTLPYHLADMSVNEKDSDPRSGLTCNHQDDFVFMSTTKPHLDTFLVPGLVDQINSRDPYVCVVGYPAESNIIEARSAIPMERLAEHVTNPERLAEIYALTMSRVEKIFQPNVLNVSPGSITKADERVCLYDCTTIGGFSGGPVLPIMSPGVYVGHHLGSSLQSTPVCGRTENLFLSSTHPVFVREYISCVLGKLPLQCLTSIQRDHLLRWLNKVRGISCSNLEDAVRQALV